MQVFLIKNIYLDCIILHAPNRERVRLYKTISLYKQHKKHAKIKYCVLYNAMQCTHLNILQCNPNPLGQLKSLFIQLNNTSCGIL